VSRDDIVAGLTCDEVVEMAGSFVLGALDPASDAAVRAHLAACPESHEEMAELGGAVVALAESVPIVEPPAGLKARIMAAAAADLAARAATPPAALAAEPVRAAEPVPAAEPARAAQPTPFPTATEREARRSRASTGSWVLRIAAVVAIVALGGWNLLLQGQVNTAKTYEQNVAAVLEVAAKPGSLTAILTADGGSGSGLAAVSASGTVTLAMQDLAPTTGSTVYTAWVIGADGVPVPLGSFAVGSNGTAAFSAPTPRIATGSVLALTREPGPGATTPTLPIISKGQAKAAA
jgi:anti-sigma factor RsiW